MANCIKCGNKCERETVLYVMEWSDNLMGGRQIQQCAVRGAVKAGLCDGCIAAYTSGRTKGIGFSRKEKDAAKAAISSGNYSAFMVDAVADAVRAKVDEPNAGKSKVFAAWAAANAADHLLNETFVPAEYAAVCLVQNADGNQRFAVNEPIKYVLNRPSVFKFIRYRPEEDAFEFVASEQWIDPKWLMASETSLRACRAFLE